MKINRHHLYLDFVISKKIYECYLSSDLTLMENMLLLLSLIEDEINQTYQIDKYFLIYEKETNTMLNMFIPLKELNLFDGCTLIVY